RPALFPYTTLFRSPVALAAVVARRPAVQRPREDREACRNAGDVKPVGRLLDKQLVATRAWGRQEHAVRLVRQALVAAEEPDQPIDLVVIGCDVVVGDGPIVAQTV